ncbi:MAG: hypothetical protein AB1756_09335 [Acidobacteriota bacterium]
MTDFRTGNNIPASIDRTGTTVVFASSGNLTGGNQDFSFEIFLLEPVTNTLRQLTDNGVGGGMTASVSDDGDRIAFMSRADLTGENHDQSAEIFVMNRDGSAIRQLTSATLGSSAGPVISGNGNWIVFQSSADLTAGNADNSDEIFIINWDGSGLRQLTSSAAGSSAGARISDDGSRVVFSSDADLTGGNPDGSEEIFVINADGTDLRQLTSAATGDSSAPSISGNGLKVVFHSSSDLTGGNADGSDELFIINWDGTGLKQLTNSKISLLEDGNSQYPSIDDNGTLIVFHSNQYSGFQNLDANYEIWKIKPDGTGLTALTSSAVEYGSFLPSLSGDASRVVFIALADLTSGNPDENPEVFTIKTDKTALTRHTDTIWGFTGRAALSADGRKVAFTSSGDLTGGNGDLNTELFIVDGNGSNLKQLTSTTLGDAGKTSITGDGGRISLNSSSNYTGSNSDLNDEIFVMDSDGTNITQLTNTLLSTNENPRISRNGSKIVFQSDGNMTGNNPDNSIEIFAVDPDGSGLLQLTSAATGSSENPSISDDGTIIAFQSTSDLTGGNPEGNSEIFVIRSDGSGLAQLTSSATGSSESPSLNGSGSEVAFSSSADLTGSNADGNGEIFVMGTDGTMLRQITSSTEGSSGGPAFSADGIFVIFLSSAPFFGLNPDGFVDLFRIRTDGSDLSRLTAIHFGGGSEASVNQDGSMVAFTGLGDYTGQNPDLLPEIFMVYLNLPSVLRVKNKENTLLSWDTVAGAWTYDVIRGSLDSLSIVADSVDLGPVSCLEDDSPDADTVGFEDPEIPLPGKGFFYLFRSFDGINNSGYGQSSSGLNRIPSTGDCIP